MPGVVGDDEPRRWTYWCREALAYRHGLAGVYAGSITAPHCRRVDFGDGDAVPLLESVVFDGYLRGLRAAGWDDDPRLVRLGMWSSAVKYDWMAAMTLEQAGHERQ